MPNNLDIKIYKYVLSEDFTRSKLYTQVDITESVLQPLVRSKRTDTGLDTSSITILNKSEEPLKPLTRIRFVLTKTYKDENNDEIQEVSNQYWLIDNDEVSLAKYDKNPSKRAYKHNVSLIEPTKWLERFDVDNTTITNMLMFLYQDAGVVSYEALPSIKTGGAPHYITPTPPSIINYTSEYDPTNTTWSTPHFSAIVSNLTGTIECGSRMTLPVTFYMLGFIHKTVTATMQEFYVIKPDGTTAPLSNDAQTYTADASTTGTYTFVQKYESSYWGMTWTFDVRWNVSFIPLEQYNGDKKPQRHTMASVVDLILSRVSRENSVCLENETPLFQLDPEQRDLLATMIAPEFTFTQSTLFDILLQIGTAMHAIPRLEISDAETDGKLWNIIHFDFLGYPDQIDNSMEARINYQKTQKSDNFATAFVSNVQNAFVSSNTSYITMTEPFEGGFKSVRTESSNFEISNDHCCIKVSRPIQRITELVCLYNNNPIEYIDLSTFCKERTDYNILPDYQYAHVDQQDAYWGKGTKEGNIYFTRGDTVIRGLDYIAPDNISNLIAPSYGKMPAIKYILMIALTQKYGFQIAQSKVNNINIRNLAFRVKYVPYLSFKMKQFRDVIEDEMETSTLFFNQNGQQVDINAFGERIKAALNMTSNQEPTFSFVSRFPDLFKNGHIWQKIAGSIGQFIPYEIREEVTTKCTITSIVYSKDFNKWNEYDAIKKNYREWEISENECIEQNPIYNQFCLISDDIDYWAVKDVDISQLTREEIQDMRDSITQYANELNGKEGFIPSGGDIMRSIFGKDITWDQYALAWAIAKFTAKEWDETTGDVVYIENSVFLQLSSAAVGNAIVLNMATKDNYSAGTTAEKPSSLSSGNYDLEVDVPYGSKYGNAETLQLYVGSTQFSKTVLSDPTAILQQAKALDKVDIDDVQLLAVPIKIWGNPIVINKDSRQKMLLTMQLNFISEKDYIWVSSKLPQRSGYTGAEIETKEIKVALFNKTPSRFFNGELDIDYSANPLDEAPRWGKMINDTVQGVTITTPTYYIDPNTDFLEITKDYAGWGLIDSNNKVILYYNKAVKLGETLPKLYFQFRDRI